MRQTLEQSSAQDPGSHPGDAGLGIRFADVESLLEALGAEVTEGKGSRVRFDLRGEQWHTHRPHPGNEAKRYQVRDLQELFQRLGIG